jgi:hypothetical protein
MINQNTPITEDGRPNKDAPFECVATAILAGVMWLLGVSQLGGKFTPDYFKDTVYGESYYGGTSAERYVGLCASLGVKLWAFNGMPAVLVSEAHKQLQQGHPVVFTEPDPYVSASLGWTHVCVFYSEEPGFLTALDPYIGRPVRRTDSEWTQLLQFQQIWILSKKEVVDEMPVTINLDMPMIKQFFEANAEGEWVCKQTSTPNKPVVLRGEMLKHYQTNGTIPLCGLSEAGLPLSNEVFVEHFTGYERFARKGITVQFFERQVWAYDPDHLIDNPPESGHVYALKLYDGGPATDPAIAELEAEVTQLKTQIAPELQAEVASLQGKIDAAAKALS